MSRWLVEHFFLFSSFLFHDTTDLENRIDLENHPYLGQPIIMFLAVRHDGSARSIGEIVAD